jgi:Mg2+ and Co2+ transporter CorA
VTPYLQIFSPHPIKQELKHLEIATRNIYDSLESLLENPDDLRHMYLTRRYSVHNSPNLSLNHHRNSHSSSELNSKPKPDPNLMINITTNLGEFVTSRDETDKDDENDEIEDLLEVYFYQIGKLLDRINIIDASVQETDDTVLMMLDIARNRMMTIDLGFNVMTASLAFGNLITGLFGMNLVNHVEMNPIGFPIVTSIICLSILMIILFFQFKLSKITI